MGTDYIGAEFSIPGKPTSLWIDTTPDTNLPALRSTQEFDTVVVGAGIAGIMTAYQLKKAGQKVAVLEQNEIIKDVTGHTTAKMTSLHGLIYKYLINTFGEGKARLYGEASQRAIALSEEIIEENEIDCDFVKVPSYTFASTEGGLRDIEEEVVAAQKLGLPAEFVKEIDLPITSFGAIRFNDQARFHPRKYLLSVAGTIPKDGSVIYEKTRALDIIEEEVCTVKTSRGDIKGKNVVVATNFPFYDKFGFYTKLTPKRSYVYGVKLKGDTPEGMYYTIDSGMHSFRSEEYDDGKVFLIGGVTHKAGQGDNEINCYKELERYARDNFEIISFLYHWSTQDNYTTDRIPYIGKSYKSDKVYIATGFNGWGMTTSHVAAMLISDLILDKENSWSELFGLGRSKPLKAAGKFVSNNINTAGQMLKRIVPRHFGLPIDVLPGEGRVIEYGGEKVAAYKDEKNEIFLMSPKCTHMGCIVEWNEAEKTWDCPCHGSRYTAKGHVIHDPALYDLEQK